MKNWRALPYQIASRITVVFPALFLLSGTVPEIAMDVIAGLFLFHSIVSNDWGWCRKQWLACLMLLWIYMIARSLFVDPQHLAASLSHSALFIRYFIFAAAVAYWTFTDPAIRRQFIMVLGCVLVFVMGDGILQYITGRDLFGYDNTPFRSIGGSARLSATFRKPIVGIMIAWFSFPVFLDLLGTDSPLRSRAFLVTLILALLAMAVISLSGERMALLLVLLGWGIAFLLLPKHRIKIIAIVIAGLLAVAGTAAVDPLVLKRQGGSTVHTLTNWWDSPYGMLLKTDMKMADINPTFGIGAYQFRIVCPTLYPGMGEEELKSVCNIHPHNMYFEWLIEEGVIGLTLFVTFLIVVLARCMSLWRTAAHNPLFAGFFIAFILRVWPLASTTGLTSRWGASPFWLVFGCLIACALSKEKQN